MKYIVLLIFTLSTLNAIASVEYKIDSPDKKIQFKLKSDNGKIHYSITRNSDAIILRSKMSISLKDTSFEKNLKIKKVEEIGDWIDEYNMLSGKRSKNKVHAKTQTFQFVNEAGDNINIIVRVLNDGFAFRYEIPRKEYLPYTVTNESTEFVIPKGMAWIEPYDELQRWGPSHEVGYEMNIPVGTTSPKPTGWAFPALFEVGKNWILISESAMDERYVSSHLYSDAKNGIYQLQFPIENENYGYGATTPSGIGTVLTPWRVGIVGDLKTIVESNLIHDLARPQINKDFSWVKPGRVAWSWWGDMSSPSNAATQKQYIDFAAEMGWEYVLIDCGWHEMRDGNVEELTAYAKQKNVGIFLWYNSSGPYTRVLDCGPIDRMHSSERRRAEFEKIKKWGIKGVKVDFFQSDKQHIMAYYESLAKDAADFELILNTHSSTIPRGWTRTYPHYLTTEAVKGAEQYPQEGFTLNASKWNATLPFTRNVIGPMDYTPTTFSDRGTGMSSVPATALKDSTNALRLTTNAHELALSVAFESGVQHLADRPLSYKGQIPEVQQFLKDLPVTWDDIHFISGCPSKTFIVARQKGNEYWVAGINATLSTEVDLDFSFLPRGQFTVELYLDGKDPRKIIFKKVSVDQSTKLRIEMLSHGGFSARIK
jgi:alpha-glucosidase